MLAFNQSRRDFLHTALSTSAVSGISPKAMMSLSTANVSAARLPVPVPGFKTPVKQIAAGELNIGYIDEGPVGAAVVVLLHGWPYDIYCYGEVTALLVAEGYRVIVPYLRGYGTTSFLSDKSFRNGQQSVFAVDVLNLMDALKIQQAIIGGCDWGARTANVIAALWPERCSALVSVSGYLIGNRDTGIKPLLPAAELQWWYQYYFATERGRAGYEKYRHEFAQLIWQLASPKWNFSEATFKRSAAALDNPDHVNIVIHNYRWRISEGAGDTRYDALERRLAMSPPIVVPAITLEGDENGAPHPQAATYAEKFRGKYSHEVITGGIGHNLPQEAPAAFANAVIQVDSYIA